MTPYAATPAFSLCVYCASRPGLDPSFTAAAHQVGTWIGNNRGQLVYGGGKNGLMGVVAQATLEAGGRVVGIIPTTLVDKEMAYTACTELHVVDTMHQRKQMMADRADAFLALPGGIGTFEEFFEVWTWKQLGYHSKPVGVLNINGYYDGMAQFLNASVGTGLMNPWQMDLVRWGTEPQALLSALLADQQAAQLLSATPVLHSPKQSGSSL
jgi:uncharacterized protein (TIGR00730 family)